MLETYDTKIYQHIVDTLLKEPHPWDLSMSMRQLEKNGIF